MQTKHIQTAKRLLAYLLFAATMVALVRSLFVGIEIDEEYALSMGFRLLSGDKLFYTMWEPHQLSALTALPLLALYRAISGGTTGVLLFVRVVMLVIKILLAVALYCSLAPAVGRWSAYLGALVLLLYTPKWFLGPDYVSQQFHYTAAMMLCLWQYYAPGPRRFRRVAWVVAGAVCACLSYLAFPQSAVAVLPLLVGIWLLGHRGGERCIGAVPQGVAAFVVTCILCALAFLVWVLQPMTVPELLSRVSLILNDPQYNFTAAQRLALLLGQAIGAARSCLVPALLTLAGMAGFALFRKKAGRTQYPLHVYIELLFWLFAVMTALWGAVQVVRQSTLDCRHYCLAVVVAGGVSFWLHRRDVQGAEARALLFWLGWLPGVVGYLFIMRSTLLALPTTFMYLQWPALCGALALALTPGLPKRLAQAVMAAMFVCIMTVRCWMVVTTGWKGTNITNTPLKQITTGPAAGVWADEKAADMQQALYEALAPYEGKQVLQAIGEQHGLGFLMANGTLTVGQASVISGTDSDPRFILYYEELPQKLPDVVLFDEAEVRDVTDFHTWIEENWPMAEHYTVTVGTATLDVLVPQR